MAKERKYCKMNDTPVRYECTKQQCKWQGTDNEKGIKQVDSIESRLICPDCGNEEFYGLLK